jgi:hypothetical protein
MSKEVGVIKRALAAATVSAAVFAVPALAAAPATTSPPTIEGKFQVGETLTAGNGGWSNSPTSFTYQWQRCSSGGSGCANITGATSRTYKLVAADVDKTLRVLVTAANTDGKSTSNSHPTPVISDASSPRNTARPVISGSARVGDTMTVTTGTWTGGVSSYTFQWQLCDQDGNACVNVPGATGRTYNVRSGDDGGTMRALVTAQNAAGKTTVNTDRSAIIQAAPSSTVVVTTPATVNKAPSIRFTSLKVRGTRVYVRFRVCDDSAKVTIVARAQMPRRLGYTRRFAVGPTPCGTYARTWKMIPRFRHHGRYVVSLRAMDNAKRLSVLVSRGVRI